MTQHPVNTPALTRADAELLEGDILQGIEQLEANLQRFIEGRGWEALGYSSFLAWWDTKVVSARVGQAVRVAVVQELQQPDPATGKALSTREIGKRLGVDHKTVCRDIRLRGTKRPNPQPFSDQKTLSCTLDMNEWQRVDKARRLLPGSWTMADFLRKAISEYVNDVEKMHDMMKGNL